MQGEGDIMTTKMIIENNVKKILTDLQKIAFENIDLPNSKLAKKLDRSPQNTNSISKAVKLKLEKLEYTDEFVEDACAHPEKYLISSKELSKEVMHKLIEDYGKLNVTIETIDRDHLKLCNDSSVWRKFLETPSESMWRTYPFNLIADILDISSEEKINSGYINIDSDVQKELAIMWINNIIKTCSIAKNRFDMIEMRYRDHMTFDDIGNKYNLTRNRPREILMKFYRQMRHPSRSKKLRFVVDVLFNSRGEVNFADIISRYEREMTMAEKQKQIVSNLVKGDSALLSDILIEELDLSVRAYNCLKRFGINTAADLVKLFVEQPEEEILKSIRNLSKHTYDDVKMKLVSMGFLKEE